MRGVVNRRPMPNHPAKGSDPVRAAHSNGHSSSTSTSTSTIASANTAALWKCDKCGANNARHKSNCGKCQALRPTLAAAPEDMSWACPKCGLVNAHRSRNCVRCQCLAPVVPRARACGAGLTGGTWACHKCGTVNSNLKNNCKQCCAVRVKHRVEKVGAPTENNLAAAAARPSSQTAQSQPPTRQAQARAAGTSLEASLSSLQRSRPASSSLQEEAGANVSTAQSAAAKSLAERYSKLLQYGERVHRGREGGRGAARGEGGTGPDISQSIPHSYKRST